ncbi:unnamed protein product, partial [Phaeothamnion confervicola]
YLHKENNAWRAFVIGIAAPALITTAAANKKVDDAINPRRETAALISSAYAAANQRDLALIMSSIKVLPITDLEEGTVQQLRRGFFGLDTRKTLVVISSETDRTIAIRVAASVALYSDCGAVKGRVARKIDIPDPVVFEDVGTKRFIVTVQFFDPQDAVAYARRLERAIKISDIGPEVLFTRQSQIADDL